MIADVDHRGRIFEATRENIERAARAIRAGLLVAFPTETVYGLGADACRAETAASIFAAKGRPSDNPLIVHVASIAEAERCASMNDLAMTLIRHLWPGPLTIVLPALDIVPPQTRAGLPTVALRMPMNETALALIRASGTPLAAPSANISGRPSPTDALSAARDIGSSVEMILDGGRTSLGVESTVVDATADRAVVLRDGGVSREQIAAIAPLASSIDDELARRSPGTRHRHYAPRVPVIAWERAERCELPPDARSWSFIGLTSPPLELGAPERSMIFASIDEYARELFRALRELESSSGAIVAELPEGSGIGRAVRDRIIRASGRTD